MRTAWKVLYLLLVLLCLPSCSGRRGISADPEDTRDARQSYARYVAKTAQEHAVPSRVRASLRFGGDNDGRRVVVLLWENGSGLGPIRLDVRAGIGANAAKILQDDNRFLLYSTQEERAYSHDDPRQTLFAYGLPLPFGLRDLAALLAGDFGVIFGTSLPEEAKAAPGGSLRFELSKKTTLGGILEISPQGLPLIWKKQDWSVSFAYDAAAVPPKPERIDVRHINGRYAVLSVKERERPSLPFTKEQLDLTLPPGTPVVPLKEMKRL